MAAQQVKNKKVFKVEIDGVETAFAAMRPNNRVVQQGQIAYSKAFREAIEGGAIVRARLNNVMRDQNLWDDKKQAEYDLVSQALLNCEKRLQRGGLKLNEARDIAIQMRRGRYDLRNLMTERNELDSKSAETLAENARFNFLVSECTVYGESGKKYFASFDDFLGREDDPVMGPATTALGQLLYGLDDDFEAKLPENKFLKAYKFCNAKLALINKDGQTVDVDGRLVDESGRLVNEQGGLIDGEGNPLTEEGDYAFETLPFLDDETGLPVTTEEQQAMAARAETDMAGPIEGDVPGEPVTLEIPF